MIRYDAIIRYNAIPTPRLFRKPHAETSIPTRSLEPDLPLASPPTGLQAARRHPRRETDEAMEGESERSSINWDNADASRVFSSDSRLMPTSKAQTSWKKVNVVMAVLPLAITGFYYCCCLHLLLLLLAIIIVVA